MDEKEVEKFKSIADVWWDLTSPTKYLHSMNKLRIPFLIDSLKLTGFITNEAANSDKPLKDMKILDVGCGCKYKKIIRIAYFQYIYRLK